MADVVTKQTSLHSPKVVFTLSKIAGKHSWYHSTFHLWFSNNGLQNQIKRRFSEFLAALLKCHLKQGRGDSLKAPNFRDRLKFTFKQPWLVEYVLSDGSKGVPNLTDCNPKIHLTLHYWKWWWCVGNQHVLIAILKPQTPHLFNYSHWIQCDFHFFLTTAPEGCLGEHPSWIA